MQHVYKAYLYDKHRHFFHIHKTWLENIQLIFEIISSEINITKNAKYIV